ncbi:MAG TPA: prepilin peptidase, partial [Clostridia bacterium]|nr:prepilin peptidase [Clostridia bacterium]
AAFIDIFHRKIPNKLILCGLSAAVALEAAQLLVTYMTTLALHSSVIGGVGESVSVEPTFFGSVLPAEAARIFVRYCGETLTRPTWTRILISQGTFDRLGGFFLLGGAMFAIATAARGGMGGGDVKLASVMGMYAGITKGVTGLLLAFIGGAVAGLILIIFKKAGAKTAIPFAPFLALGGFLGFIYGDTLFVWYLSGMVAAGGGP